ncbi:malonate decarboxylase holo-ACP synthase [Saccharopolyspora sp. K220]|uniref:malonate decarboxylase holo-ACP synthase n=1 Tax=Saccharopolyspora soli TaxID=2926618 RepID=UPI001F5ACDC6|nr:malonate decarboxylase holo-ACP synthase [Saccharopolyspora soli]MCI2421917.1 malonate decarboxylase holo-ACP synthase [Saccharopolyspora soli]
MIRPHDLLRLNWPVTPATAPRWVVLALCRTPWVVARRALAAEGRVAVGVRGPHRAQRFALDVPLDAVAAVLPPEALTARAHTLRAELPAVRALHAVRPRLDRTGLRWGPGGSVGFELATGLPAITRDSDLDIVLRVEHPPPLAELAAVQASLQDLSVRVDCQLDAPWGAVALAELLSGADRVLLRTPNGPRLVWTETLT